MGATEGSFYRAKYKYFSSGSGEESQGSFLQLTPGTYSHAPAMNRRPKSKKPFFSQSVSSSARSIEIKTLSGTMLRIQGVMDSTLVSSIIQATDNHA